MLRLGVWGLGVDVKSVRSVRKRSLCVRKRSPCVRKRPRQKSSRNAELSSLLDSRWVFAFQKCQQSQGSWGSWLRNAELSSLLDSRWVFAFQKCHQSQGSGGGRGREPQNCRHCWTRVASSRLKSVNSHRDRGVVVAKRRREERRERRREEERNGENRREEERGGERR